MKKNERKDSKLVEVVFILDRSGSMTGLEADTIGGFNATLKQQKDEASDLVWTTVLFDDKYELLHDRIPAEKLQPITEKEDYVRGMTALLDAVGRTITHIAMKQRYDERRPDRTLFVITTDGMENASREYCYNDIKKMIEREKAENGWEFMFLGANIDSVNVAGRMGIAPSRTADFVNDSVGISKNYAAVGAVMHKMARCESFDSDALFEASLAPVRKDHKARGRR